MSAEALAIVAVGAALLAALVPLLLSMRASLADLRDDVKTLRTETRSDMADLRDDVKTLRTETRSDMAELRDDVQTLRTETRSDMADLRGDVQALGERVARIEGRLDALAPVMVPMRRVAEPAEPPAPAA